VHIVVAFRKVALLSLTKANYHQKVCVRVRTHGKEVFLGESGLNLKIKQQQRQQFCLCAFFFLV